MVSHGHILQTVWVPLRNLGEHRCPFAVWKENIWKWSFSKTCTVASRKSSDFPTEFSSQIQNDLVLSTRLLVSLAVAFSLVTQRSLTRLKTAARETTGLIMWIGHRKEIRKLTFRALALRRSGKLRVTDCNGRTFDWCLIITMTYIQCTEYTYWLCDLISVFHGIFGIRRLAMFIMRNEAWILMRIGPWWSLSQIT